MVKGKNKLFSVKLDNETTKRVKLLPERSFSAFIRFCLFNDKVIELFKKRLKELDKIKRGVMYDK